MEKNKKDIVENIVENLKAKQELPYREGAWENFQRRHGSSSKKSKVFYWATSAAAALILGVLGVNHWFLNQSESQQFISNNTPEEIGNSYREPSREKSDAQVPLGETSENIEIDNMDESTLAFEQPAQRTGNNINNLIPGELTARHLAYTPYSLFSSTESLATRSIESSPTTGLSTLGGSNHRASIDGDTHITLAQSSQEQREVDGQQPNLRDRRFKIMDKFQLGLFVSPNSTNERFNFGGGLLLAYHISNKLSVRTGLAYNKYEVSEMRDPVGTPEMEVRTSLNGSQMLTSNGSVQAMLSNSLVLPNVNAITGNVQALEVPLDLKYTFNDGFYASSGMTYAAILQQNRYAHYIENANQELFQNGLPENQTDLQSEVKQISRSIKTEDENVRSNQFGGFVNFSIGKEMRLNKGVSMSVEPYFKLPVGSFKRADMNYTNGGIRIITNF